MGSFSNTVALVTGATSGIGAASSRAMASEGARVALVGRNEAAGEALCAEVRALGSEALFIAGDICDPNFCVDAVDRTVKAFGGLNVLANVAGVIRRGDALQTSIEDWRQVMTTNVDGTLWMSCAAIPAMRSGGGGSIVNVGSIAGLFGATGLVAYCASKGAVISLTRAMALDHASEGIRVNAVCPGAVDTPMLVSEHLDPKVTAEEVRERNREAIPQQRLPSPEEIAQLVVFLASNASSHITGTAIPIDGGVTAA